MTQKINMHGNHEATCLCCKHFDIGYEGDYSDMTPGAGWYARCGKGHFYLNNSDAEDGDMHEEWGRGRTCPDFEGK
jgi:hypothetical protein